MSKDITCPKHVWGVNTISGEVKCINCGKRWCKYHSECSEETACALGIEICSNPAHDIDELKKRCTCIKKITKKETEFNYIVWDNHGEGWSPTGYEILEDAVKHHDSYGSESVITKLVKYKVEEIK